MSGDKRLSDVEYEGKKRKTRREVFLERMDGLIPRGRLEARIEPFYPKAGRGRRPYRLSVMLRIHCVQLFYDMSDPGMEASVPAGRKRGVAGPKRPFFASPSPFKGRQTTKLASFRPTPADLWAYSDLP